VIRSTKGRTRRKIPVQLDMEGNPVPSRPDPTETRLLKSDRRAFKGRLERLKYLESISPQNIAIAGSPETVFLLQEAGQTFVNGTYIATMLLAQAFIERRLQVALMTKGVSEKDLQGLKEIINQCRKHHLLDETLLKKIDHLRQARNPFTHLKALDHPFTMSRRMASEGKMPDEILEKDAKDALVLMNMVIVLRL
jgi:hypothetical protein